MPTYPYGCKNCKHEFDVIKSIKDFDSPEACPRCGVLSTERYISLTNFSGADNWDSHYNPGLGCVVKNRHHAARIAKQRGLIEVGNESCEKVMAANERKREELDTERSKDAMDGIEYGLKKAQGRI